MKKKVKKNLVISSSASDDSLGQERENEIFKGGSDTSECPADDDFLQILKSSAYYRRATSIILQGRLGQAQRRCFYSLMVLALQVPMQTSQKFTPD